MQAMLMTMNSTTAVRLRMAPSWHPGGPMPVCAGTGGIALFQATGRFRGGADEQRKGSRVSASGEAV